jgi:glyoxylase-like metal-dependent hydrolase (beta-lactamase superfamily II)
LKVVKLAENFYVIQGDGGNSVVRVTSEGVILVDGKHESSHDALMKAVKSITSQPIKYVFTTHYHEDHSGGNAKLLPMATLISTLNTRMNILEHKRPNDRPVGPNNAAASLTFTDQFQIVLGGVEVRAGYFGRAHTNGDLVVYFPDMKAVSMGDMFSGAPGATPTIDYAGGGSLVEQAKTFDKIYAAYDIDTVIPGHGDVTNRAAFKTFQDNFVKMTARAQAFIRQGKSPEELSKFMETEFGWAPNSTQQIQNVPGMMKELK